MPAEVDINKPIEKVVEPIPNMGIMEFDPEKHEIFQTDINLKSVIFFNPIYWMKFKILTGGPAGFGFWIGPLLLSLEIVKLVRLKEDKHV